MRRITSSILFVSVACAATIGDSASSQAPPGFVGVREPTRPTDVIRTLEGSCAGNRYTVAIVPDARGKGSLRELRVGSAPVLASQQDLVTARVPEHGNVWDVAINECLNDGSARIRFRIVESKSRPIREPLLDFTLRPDGKVKDVQVID